MRLIVHAQRLFGKALLESIIDRNKDEVVAVYVPPAKGSRRDVLEEFATEKGVAVYQPSTWKDPRVWQQIEDHKADLCVMADVPLFVPEEALYAPVHGSIQLHPSLLPYHRGPSPTHWPIIFGESETGVTVFWPDNGLDTGPILLSRRCEIRPDDTVGSLWSERLFPLGLSALLEAIDLVREDNAPKQVQDPQAGSYEGWCGREVSAIDWTQPARDIMNLIRGCDPRPGAWTTLTGQEVRLFGCSVEDAVSNEPAGTIVSAHPDGGGIVVAVNDGGLRIRRVQPRGLKRMDAHEWITDALPVLCPGQRFTASAGYQAAG